MDKKFLLIDNIAEYVKGYALEGEHYFHEAIKTATVKARRVKEGEIINTKTSDGLDETKNIGIKDEKGELGWVVTNPGGEEYIVSNDEFSQSYTQVTTDEYVKGKPVITMKLEDDIAFNAPWGEEMKIQAGGYLIINGKDDIYGIQEVSFNETYRMTDRPKYEAYMEMGKIMEFDKETMEEMKFNGFLSKTLKDVAEDTKENFQPRVGDLDKILAEIKKEDMEHAKNKESITSAHEMPNDSIEETNFSDDTVL